MKFLLTLLNPNELAIVELEGLFRTEVSSVEGLAFLETKEQLFNRLAYCRDVYRFLFHCKVQDLPTLMKSFDWQSVYRSNFCIRLHDCDDYSEAELAGFLWRSVKNPVVNLTSPRTKIEIYARDGIAYAGLLLQQIDHKFEQRKAHQRPRLHPSSLHPKLARAMVNMTGIRKGSILDPFCGTGGILIEAGLMGLKPVGMDIDKKMIERAKINMSYFKLKWKLRQADATKFKGKVGYIVTDLPYGRNTKKDSALYRKFFLVLDRVLQGRAVVGLPSNIDEKSLLRKMSLRRRASLTYYLHKSLSKRILILDKKAL